MTVATRPAGAVVVVVTVASESCVIKVSGLFTAWAESFAVISLRLLTPPRHKSSIIALFRSSHLSFDFWNDAKRWANVNSKFYSRNRDTIHTRTIKHELNDMMHTKETQFKRNNDDDDDDDGKEREKCGKEWNNMQYMYCIRQTYIYISIETWIRREFRKVINFDSMAVTIHMLILVFCVSIVSLHTTHIKWL